MKLTNHSIIILLFTLCTSCVSNKVQLDQTTIYFVRHAEKADDSKDPKLSMKGTERANALAARLKSTKLSKVYSTNYKRTRNTATPTAEAADLTVELYDPRNNAELINQLKNRAGQSMLVVGHSNSTPTLVNQITGGEQYKTLGHEEYDKIFIVQCDKEWKCTTRIETYN